MLMGIEIIHIEKTSKKTNWITVGDIVNFATMPSNFDKTSIKTWKEI